MNTENNNNSRSSFLKNLAITIVSVFGLGMIGSGFQKLQRFLGFNVKSISVSEANNYIANMHSPDVKPIKPKSPPKIQETSDRLLTNEI
jgi:hypothetical protein